MRPYPGLAGLVVTFGRALDRGRAIVVIVACHALQADYNGYGGRHVPPEPHGGGRRRPANFEKCRRGRDESLS